MALAFERIYVRFRGRVLGPMTRDKFGELVQRGQIAKDHEISPDGISWKLAGDFPELFNESSKSIQSERVVSSAQVESTIHSDEWYVNIEGQSRGPYSRESLRTWQSTGLLKEETPVWIEGLPDWTTAGMAFKEWFPTNKQPPQSQSNQEVDAIRALVEALVAPRSWITSIGIIGLIACFLGVLASLFQMGLVAMLEAEVATKIQALAPMMLNMIVLACFVVGYVTLLGYSSRLSRIRQSATHQDLLGALQAHAKLWKILCIMLILALLLSLTMGIVQGIMKMVASSQLLLSRCSYPNCIENLACGLFV